jgi:hypothetical protein
MHGPACICWADLTPLSLEASHALRTHALLHQWLAGLPAAARAAALADPVAPRGAWAPFAFSLVNRFCMGIFYGRAGRLPAKNGGFRPLVPPPVWSNIYSHKRILAPVSPY